MPPGSIRRLVLLAGPSGAGKSAFLREPSRYLDESALPPELVDLFHLAPQWRPIGGMASRSGKPLESVCIHVDLNTPLRSLTPESRDDLAMKLKASLYEGWSDLTHCLEAPDVVDVITFHVQRDVHFQRWLYDKRFPRNPGGGVLNTMVAINGDSADGGALHAAVYRAWFAFLTRRAVRCHVVMEASTDRYRFLTPADFMEEAGWPATA